MSQKRKKEKPKSAPRGLDGSSGNGWGTALVVGGTAILAGTWYYLKAGAGAEKNAAFIPDLVEDPIDRIVDFLNVNVGRNWVEMTRSTLEKAIEHALPPKIVGLLNVIYRAEVLATENRIEPSAKKAWAQNRIAQFRLS